ncbi:CDP-diacylglycerol-glycerol-3-phosphate 3-phosphatidyltransferas-like protein [Cucurbitaria berberidis CBS 394.84]|uniref:CDP-diacylglycerol--glycerol-3-phosphate 3-phosphatidyltransferase n=1 Tax=Cucurbitaria berberidis CBS 394.84 TaxID=1168544 RepID=A0A9P4LDE3_9PLEO|nr:CDP-diacylglycerol-glycerol-3-phosphate 3-phosphatidyltransferas-like protein [Cucurbitaria berberidis CBS 394.84]KAF1850940.1 CDP-diacylglycerol-glycerol-3-phosphate 3-phosphatidyltransferas-like protein [Cucurbitaria berberidis CBS 394.84]
MIIRGLLRVQAPKIAGRRSFQIASRPMRATRRYSTANAPQMASSTPQSQASMLATITTDLDRIAPKFEMHPEQIQIIQTPTEFYETLKDKISKAQRRIYLSTLYIGKTEHELISTIRAALLANPNLHVSFLTDALRGTRETPDPSSASLLTPLISEFGPDRVEVRMYHTPNLTGLRKKYVPKRINEGWGLQHMKLYGVDDEIIMSGANLSSDYFSNRQDRYHLFRSKDLTDYFHKVHSGVANLSFDFQPSDAPGSGGYSMTWPSSNPAPSPLEAPSKFRDAASKHLSHLLTPSNSPAAVPNTSTTTTVYPVLSLVPLLKTSTELPALTQILTSMAKPPFHPCTWTFTAGYFNMTPSFRRLLLSTKPTSGTVLTAHPHANGFFGSKGVSGMLPDAYTHLAKMFLRKVRHEGLSERIQLREWQKGVVGQKEGWTYHAKGLWVTFPSAAPLESAGIEDPSLTVVGSSNYTKRSYELDLEANVIIATSDPGLRRRLGEEVKWLGEYAKPVDESEFEKPDRKVSLSVRLSMWVVRVLGGAL